MTNSRRGWRDLPLVQLTLVRYREFYREPEAVFWVFIFPVLLTAGLGVPLAYVIGLFVVAARAGTDGTLTGPSLTWLPVVLATMHLCWGAGFLTSSRRLGGPRRGP